MSVVEITSPVMTESAGQAIATAISTMSSTSVGNLSALTTTDKSSLVGAINELKSGLNNLLKYKILNESATDTTNHLYSTGVNCNQYVCIGGCTPYNPNFMIQLSNIEVTTSGYIRYRLYDVANDQIVSDNAAYTVELVFVDMSMLRELVITP